VAAQGSGSGAGLAEATPQPASGSGSGLTREASESVQEELRWAVEQLPAFVARANAAWSEFEKAASVTRLHNANAATLANEVADDHIPSPLGHLDIEIVDLATSRCVVGLNPVDVAVVRYPTADGEAAKIVLRERFGPAFPVRNFVPWVTRADASWATQFTGKHLLCAGWCPSERALRLLSTAAKSVSVVARQTHIHASMPWMIPRLTPSKSASRTAPNHATATTAATVTASYPHQPASLAAAPTSKSHASPPSTHNDSTNGSSRPPPRTNKNGTEPQIVDERPAAAAGLRSGTAAAESVASDKGGAVRLWKVGDGDGAAGALHSLLFPGETMPEWLYTVDMFESGRGVGADRRTRAMYAALTDDLDAMDLLRRQRAQELHNRGLYLLFKHRPMIAALLNRKAEFKPLLIAGRTWRVAYVDVPHRKFVGHVVAHFWAAHAPRKQRATKQAAHRSEAGDSDDTERSEDPKETRVATGACGCVTGSGATLCPVDLLAVRRGLPSNCTEFRLFRPPTSKLNVVLTTSKLDIDVLVRALRQTAAASSTFRSPGGSAHRAAQCVSRVHLAHSPAFLPDDAPASADRLSGQIHIPAFSPNSATPE
jgi:hypothetical protein